MTPSDLSKIIVNSGESVTAPNLGGSTPRMHGYLISSAKAPGTAVHFGNGDYTVSSGKTLFITHVVAAVGTSTDVTIAGKLFIQAGTRPEGETVYIPVMAGKVISVQGSSAFHGYLKSDDVGNEKGRPFGRPLFCALGGFVVF